MKKCVALVFALAFPLAVFAAPVNYEVEFVDGAPQTTYWGYDVNSPGGAYFARYTGADGDAVYTGFNSAAAKCVFVGTSATLVGKCQGNGGPFQWVLDDGVATGTDTMLCSNPGQDPKNFDIASGLADTMHTVSIQSTGVTGADFMFINRLVAEQPTAPTVTFVDQGSFTYAAPGDWALAETGDGAANDCLGGSTSYTTGDPEVWTYTFTGTAVAVLCRLRSDGSSFSYEVRDAGNNLEAAGNFNTQKNPFGPWSGYWARWPFLCANNLPAGTHTLKVTKTGFIVFFDGLYYLASGSSVADWQMY
jgi:hypothetical protein